MNLQLESLWLPGSIRRLSTTARGIRLVWWFIGTTLSQPAHSHKTGYYTNRMSQSGSHHANDANIIRDN